MLMLHTTWEIWQIFIENSNPFTLSETINNMVNIDYDSSNNIVVEIPLTDNTFYIFKYMCLL